MVSATAIAGVTRGILGRSLAKWTGIDKWTELIASYIDTACDDYIRFLYSLAIQPRRSVAQMKRSALAWIEEVDLEVDPAGIGKSRQLTSFMDGIAIVKGTGKCITG